MANLQQGSTSSTSSTVSSSSSETPPAALSLPVDEQPPLSFRHRFLYSVLSSQMFPSGIFRPPRSV
jgi:hypothetical protein